MRWRLAIGLLSLAVGACTAASDASPGGDAQQAEVQHLNPMITLHQQGKPMFGLYRPSARERRRPGQPAPANETVKTPEQLAQEVMAHPETDYVFDGSMEGGVDRGIDDYTAFVAALRDAGATIKTFPLVVKTPIIAPDPAKAADNIARELNTGASTIMFVGVESADEVKQGLAAMRFQANGGMRPDDVGDAPAYWGMSAAEYRQKADLWPLNPNGELTNWTIVESKEGLAHVDEIASVPGIGVLWPGAGTLRGVFSSTGPDGKRVTDTEAWENAIQQVLAACKAHNLPCGYPANNPDEMKMRREQGFSVFVSGWGDDGFATVQAGHQMETQQTSSN